MTQLIDTVTTFLDSDQWSYKRMDSKTEVVFRFEGESGEWTCHVKTLEQRGQVACYSLCPVIVQADQLAAIAELITRANDGLIVGNFELSYTSRLIRFKTSLDVEGETLAPLVVKHLIYDNVFTMNRYLPAIRAVLEQGVTPAQAIAQAEGRSALP